MRTTLLIVALLLAAGAVASAETGLDILVPDRAGAAMTLGVHTDGSDALVPVSSWTLGTAWGWTGSFSLLRPTYRPGVGLDAQPPASRMFFGAAWMDETVIGYAGWGLGF